MGPGTITADLARKVGPTGEVLGVDSAPDAVRAAEQGQHADNLRFAVGDVMALDLPDAGVDVVHAHQVLQHLHDPVGALRELRRVTRPGGLVAARDADYAAMTWHPASDGLAAWLATYRASARALGAEPDAGRRLLSWARAAGFAEVAASASVWCFADDADRAWWGGMQAARIVQSAIAGRAVSAGVASAQDLQRMSRAWRTWAADGDAWFAVLHGEVLCRVGQEGPA